MSKSIRNVLLILVVLGSSVWTQGYKKTGDQTNLDRFYIFGTMKAHISRDSIQASIFVDIPNYAIQFLKSDSGFISHYDLQLSVLDEDKKQIHQYLWSETVHTNKYVETMSLEENTLFSREFAISKAPFSIKVEILDRDTRKRASKILEFNPELHEDGSLAILPTIVLNNAQGNWGFGDGFLPLFKNRVNFKSDSMSFYVSGWASNGYAQIELKNESNNSIQWAIQDTVAVQNGILNYELRIPVENLKGLKNKIHTIITQNGNTVTDIQEITMRKQGMSVYVSDIGMALDQMRYLLTSDEKKLTNKATLSTREELFDSFWKKRDPTVGTPINELMDEYYRRVAFANEYFSSYKPGWETDMGKIYILLGPPEDRDRVSSRSSRTIKETWYYFRISQNFIFLDREGFGDFILSTPFLY